jgi:hypothetical protein
MWGFRAFFHQAACTTCRCHFAGLLGLGSGSLAYTPKGY